MREAETIADPIRGQSRIGGISRERWRACSSAARLTQTFERLGVGGLHEDHRDRQRHAATTATSSRARCSRTSCAKNWASPGRTSAATRRAAAAASSRSTATARSSRARCSPCRPTVTRSRPSRGSNEGGKLHPLQQAFWDQHGLQCGYCTPGMLMTSYVLLKHKPDPSDAEIREALCRESLPLHRLSEHRQGGAASGQRTCRRAGGRGELA